MRCADLERSCVRGKEVSPWMMVAATTARTMGVRRWVCLLPITSSTRYLVEAGRIRPESRLMAIRPRPRISSPRRGWIKAQTSGRAFQALLSFLERDGSASVAAGVFVFGGWVIELGVIL